MLTIQLLLLVAYQPLISYAANFLSQCDGSPNGYRDTCTDRHHSFWGVHNLCNLNAQNYPCPAVNNIKAIPTIVPTLKPLVDGIESRTNKIPSSLPTIAFSHLPTIKNYVDDIPTIIPTIAPRVPTSLYPTVDDTNDQLTISSASRYSPTRGRSMSTIRYEIEQIKEDIFDIELILAKRHNQTIDELKAYLDGLHSRVQLRPTSAPTLNPTDPTNEPTTDPTYDPTIDPTTDPTNDPTLEPTIPSAEPTNYPTSDPTKDPTTDPTKDPTRDPTLEPTLEPTDSPTNDPTSDPTRDPTADPTDDPTNDPTQAPTITWVYGLTIGGNDNSYDGEVIDVQQAAFNLEFQTSQYHIIQRECDSCADDYKLLYYKRLSNPGSFDAYSYMRSWVDANNLAGDDYLLYETMEDALLMNYEDWADCSETFGSPKSSGFGNCYKKRARDGLPCQYGFDVDDPDYNPLYHSSCNRPVRFSIFVGDPEYYGVNAADIPAPAKKIRDRSIETHDNDEDFRRRDFEDGSWEDHGVEFKGHGNIWIMINAKEFDLGMIFVMFLMLIGLNIMALKYRCCGCDNKPNYKYRTVKFDDSEFESEAVPIKQ